MTIVAISGQLNAGKDAVADCFVREGYTKIALADPLKRLAYDVFDFTEDQLWGPSQSRNEVDYRFNDRAFWEVSELCLQTSGPKWLKTVISEEDKVFFSYALLYLNDWFYSLQKSGEPTTPRVVLQKLGTEFGRDVLGNEVWLDYFSRVVRLLKEPGLEYDRVLGVGDFGDQVPRGGNNIVVTDVRFNNELGYFRDKLGAKLLYVNRAQSVSSLPSSVLGHASEQDQNGFDLSQFDAIVNNHGTLEELTAAATKLAKIY